MLAPCPRWSVAFVGSGCCLLPVPAAVPAAVPSSFFFAGRGLGEEEEELGLLRLEPGQKKMGKFRFGRGIRAEQDAAW